MLPGRKGVMCKFWKRIKRLRREVCPKCGIPYSNKRPKSQHHILPRRHFGHGRTAELCRKCHDALERHIPFEEKPKWFYYWVFTRFMEGEL